MMMRGGVRARRFQTGGVNDPTRAGANAGDPLAAKPTSTSTTPADPTGGAYWSWTPAQQQAWSNGATADQVNAMAAPAAATPAAAAPAYTFNPYAPPSQNPTPPTGFEAIPFGQGTSVVQTPAAYAAQIAAENASPMMTPAAIANQNAVANAGLPPSLQGNPMVTINGQQVPYNSLTNEQQTMLSYFNATGQQVPSNFLSTYQGPNAAWNAPSLNALTVPTGSSIVNGALVNSSGNFTNPGSFSGNAKVGTGAGIGGSGGVGGIASPGAFTSSAPGAGVGTGMGAAGAPTASPSATAPQTGEMGQSGGLGYRRGGAIAERRAPMRIRPRRFQAGGVNPGGVNPQQLAALLQARGAAGGAGMPPAMPPGGMPPGGMPPPGAPSPGAGAAGMGAMAGALPGGPGAAALGAMAGAAPGVGGATSAPGGAPPGGAPGGAGMGVGGAPAQSPNQQWGQLLLSGAPNTGLGNQTSSLSPQMQQALYRAYQNRLGQGGTGATPGVGGMARGGSVEHESIGHVSPSHQDHASYRYPLESDAFGGGAPEHTPGAHPDRQWGDVAEPTDRKAKGGRISTFDSTKPAPGNLATSQAGKEKFARGGKSVLRRRPPAPSKEKVRNLAPPPPPQDLDRDEAPPPTPGPAMATPAPSVPPPAGAPFAKGGGVCEKCGKAHGGACKGMRGGGKFHGAKAKKPKMAEGGNFIQGAIKHPGALHKQLGVPQGEKIPAGKLAKAAKAPGKLGQRARLAETLKGMNKAKGGEIEVKRHRHEKLAQGGKFAAGGAAKQRRGYPNTMAPPKKQKFAKGGKIRGSGAAERGTSFSGIY